MATSRQSLMKKTAQTGLAALCLALGAPAATAQTSQTAQTAQTLQTSQTSQTAETAETVIVTRKTADLYSVQGDDVLLMTVSCLVYALTAPAKLQPEGGRMVLRFDASVENGAGCEMRDMLKPQAVPRGRFQVMLSLDSTDWYAIEGTNLLLRTLGCQRRLVKEPAVWFQPLEGKGVIEFRSGIPCTSDGVFGSVRRHARSKVAAGAAGR